MPIQWGEQEDKDHFVESFKAAQKRAKQINVSKGFNEIDTWIKELANVADERVQRLLPALRNARVGLKLMLIVSELGEALESLRKGNGPDNHIPAFTGMEAELADATIRMMNLASDEDYRLADAIVAKTDYNEKRPYKHGGKVF